LHFAESVAGKFIELHRIEFLRTLQPPENFGDVGEKIPDCITRNAFCQHDVSDWDLSDAGIRHPNDSCLLDAGISDEDSFDFGRVDVESSPNNQIFLSVK
jgi:hypothetical protein